MSGLYTVDDIDWSDKVLHLRGGGGKRFRVRLGTKALAAFSAGMKVQLRKAPGGGLVLETTKPGRLAQSRGGAVLAGGKDRRRDRRKAPRVEFVGQTAVTLGARTILCSARDISTRGIGLRLDKHEELTGPLALSFKLHRAHRLLKIAGVVTRVGRTASESVWGVRFRDVGKDVMSALETFVAAGAGGFQAERQTSKMDRSLAGLYEDAVSELKDNSGR